MKKLLEKFTREDLPNDGLRELSDVIGINEVKAVMVKLPGVTIHVPKTIYRESDMNYLKTHKDDNPETLADVLGCSQRTIYRKLAALK